MSATRIHSDRPTGIIVHGLHKTGTMFLYQLFRRLSRARRIACYSGNHERPNDHLVTPDIDHDFCLCPIRTFCDAPFPFTGNQQIKRIFHVRDPRDILVSQYFSYGWRHSAEEFNPGRHRQRESIQTMSIDEYVLDESLAIHPMKLRLRDLIDRDDTELGRVIKYEEMVTDFPAWLAKVLPPFEFRFPGLVRRRFALRYRNEFRPDDDPRSHKRSVYPGDYLRRLQPATVQRLNELLEFELRVLNYDLEAMPTTSRAA
ncbi:MAG: hypothetical protein ACR2NP_10310 [Pirellulaceae bacterium]